LPAATPSPSTSPGNPKRIELTSQQFRAAKEALPFEEPKLSAMAVGSMSGQDFASLLERAIRASNREAEVKLIQAKVASDGQGQ
jgi:hypothetical protein